MEEEFRLLVACGLPRGNAFRSPIDTLDTVLVAKSRRNFLRGAVDVRIAANFFAFFRRQGCALLGGCRGGFFSRFGGRRRLLLLGLLRRLPVRNGFCLGRR